MANTISSGLDENDEAELEAEGLLKQASLGGSSQQGSLSSAQRSLLQALELQMQVQQYAEATLAAMRSQERLQLLGAAADPPGWIPPPANLSSVLRSHSARLMPPLSLGSSSSVSSKPPASPAGARKGSKKGSCDDMMGVLRACQRQAVSSHDAAAPSDSYLEEVSSEARRAAGIVRATSTRQRAHNARE